MTSPFEAYLVDIDGKLKQFQADIQALRYKYDVLTMGDYADMPADATPEQLYRLRRSSFIAMNTDWDLANAARTVQAARDRLTRV